jgi:multimeric flavodoxin WrbA
MSQPKKISRRDAIKYAGMSAVGAAAAYIGTKFWPEQKNLDTAPPQKNQRLPDSQNKTNMKVLLVNGSPHKKGCTYTALSEVASALEKDGVAAEIFWLGIDPVAGCRGCGSCRSTGRCILNDSVNATAEKVSEFDGFVFGSPVHYAAASGFITPFLDRLFYSAGKRFAGKPGAAVVSCRRAGSTAALEQLNKYFTICNMPVAPSQYWNMVHGNNPDEVRKDLEGMQTMRTLGQNMAWLLKCIAAGKAAGVDLPAYEARVATNFIR